MVGVADASKLPHQSSKHPASLPFLLPPFNLSPSTGYLLPDHFEVSLGRAVVNLIVPFRLQAPLGLGVKVEMPPGFREIQTPVLQARDKRHIGPVAAVGAYGPVAAVGRGPPPVDVTALDPDSANDRGHQLVGRGEANKRGEKREGRETHLGKQGKQGGAEESR